MRKRMVLVVGLVAVILAVLMMQLYTPKSVGPLGVLAFFILLYLFCGSTIYLLLSTGLVAGQRLGLSQKWLVRIEGVSRRKLYYYASFVALAPVIILGMGSVGNLKVSDIALVLLFQLLGLFYISRRF